MKPATLLFSAAILGALTSSGCQQQPARLFEGPAPGVRIRDAQAPDARLNLDTVVILDKSLQNSRASKLAVESSIGRRTATGTLEVSALIRNRTDFPLQIEGRTQFFDATGFPVEEPTAWQRLMLDPQSVNTYRELSVRTDDIAHFYVEIREGF